jgi:hypothetical protein
MLGTHLLLEAGAAALRAGAVRALRSSVFAHDVWAPIEPRIDRCSGVGDSTQPVTLLQPLPAVHTGRPGVSRPTGASATGGAQPRRPAAS